MGHTDTITQEPTDVVIGNEIRAQVARRHSNTTQLALAVGIHRHTMRQKLNGESSFSILELNKVATALGTTGSAILHAAETAMAQAS